MNNRKRYQWKIGRRTLLLGERTLIMGVLNVTPDSFTDGGKFSDPDRAFAHAVLMEEEGVDIIDVGAESTRPGSQRISEAEELRRLIPVLKRLQNKLSVPISVDTYKSAVAEKAMEYGVEIVNDPSSLTFDPNLARTAANHDAGLILNHMRGTPESWAKLPPLKDVTGSIFEDLQATVHRAVRSGMDRSRIAIDPGLGFGKRKEQNSEILARLPELVKMDLPILVGPSRKSFLSQTTSAQITDLETEYATAAAVTAAILGGTHMVRVHNVKDMRIVVQIADSILSAGPEPVEPEQPAPPPRQRTDRATQGRTALRPGLRR
jgi:dihydropteroate synthase